MEEEEMWLPVYRFEDYLMTEDGRIKHAAKKMFSKIGSTTNYPVKTFFDDRGFEVAHLRSPYGDYHDIRIADLVYDTYRGTG